MEKYYPRVFLANHYRFIHLFKPPKKKKKKDLQKVILSPNSSKPISCCLRGKVRCDIMLHFNKHIF